MAVQQSRVKQSRFLVVKIVVTTEAVASGSKCWKCWFKITLSLNSYLLLLLFPLLLLLFVLVVPWLFLFNWPSVQL